MELIRQAGEKILEIYNGLEADWDVRLKEDRTPVTEADRISNRIITEGLRQALPRYPPDLGRKPPDSIRNSPEL